MPGDILDSGLHDSFGERLVQADDDGTKTVFARRYGADGIAFKKLLIEPVVQACRIAFAPRITHLYFYDDSQSAGSKWINLLGASPNLIDAAGVGSTGTTLDSWATADFLYVGTNRPNLGLFIDMLAASVNGTTSTLTAAYGKNDATFASTAITDGTASGGATLAQDGNIDINTR